MNLIVKLTVCKGYRILCCKNNLVDCWERVRCYWSYGLGLGLEPRGLVNITDVGLCILTAMAFVSECVYCVYFK